MLIGMRYYETDIVMLTPAEQSRLLIQSGRIAILKSKILLKKIKDEKFQQTNQRA
jgi:hypothetical protein